MVNTKCVICNEEIKENFRIEVYARRLGKIKKLEGYHNNCWERLVKKNRESLSTDKSGTELQFKVPSQSSDKPCPNGCAYSRSMNQKYPRKCIVCGTIEKDTRGQWMPEDTY